VHDQPDVELMGEVPPPEQDEHLAGYEKREGYSFAGQLIGEVMKHALLRADTGVKSVAERLARQEGGSGFPRRSTLRPAGVP
jgi:hypothetical protein